MLYAMVYATSLLQNVLFIFLVRKVCAFELTKSRLLFGLASLLAAVPQFVFVFPSSSIPALIRILLVFLMMLMKAGCYAALFRQIKLKMLYISALSFILNTIYSNMMHLFLENQRKLSIAACLAESCIIVLVLLMIRRMKAAAIITSSLEQIPTKLYIMILFFLYFFGIFEFTTVIPKLNPIARYMIIPVTLMISFVLTRIMKISIDAREHERISEILSEQLENQIGYYQKINDIYSEFRAFRHDFRNHLICVRSLLEENEVAQATAYIDEIENMSHSRKKTYETGNIIIDSLLNDKNESAAQHHTQIIFSGFVPTSGITNADLCTIFANALDNAIEACAKDSADADKQINIRSDFRQGYFCLKITNPVFETVEIRNGNQIKTSKEETSLHGFGIANIVKTAKKYGGEVKLSADQTLFTLEADLWLMHEV